MLLLVPNGLVSLTKHMILKRRVLKTKACLLLNVTSASCVAPVPCFRRVQLQFARVPGWFQGRRSSFGKVTEIETHRAWRNAFPSSTKRTAHQRRQIDRNSFARMEIVTTSCIPDMGFCAKKISLGGLRGNFSRYIFLLSHDSASQDTKEPSLFRPHSSDPRRALQSEARSHPMVEEPQQAAE